jgi:hypothetical protein
MLTSPIKKLIHAFIVFSFLWLNVYPLLASSMELDSQSMTMEMCSSNPDSLNKSIQIQIGDLGSSDHHSNYCQLCCISHINDLAIQPGQRAYENTRLSSYFPELFYHSPSPLFQWLTLPSRGPPQIT